MCGGPVGAGFYSVCRRCVGQQTYDPANTFKPLESPLSQLGGGSVLLSNECLEMCTIFFQNSLKHILVPYKAVRFAVPVNILIIDVNRVPTSKEPGWLSL